LFVGGDNPWNRARHEQVTRAWASDYVWGTRDTRPRELIEERRIDWRGRRDSNPRPLSWLGSIHARARSRSTTMEPRSSAL